jgi:hypothetical protein
MPTLCQGNRAEAQKALDHLKEVPALSWVALLDQAYKDRSYNLPTYLATDARIDSLRSEPRFSELQRRVGLPHSGKAARRAHRFGSGG